MNSSLFRTNVVSLGFAVVNERFLLRLISSSNLVISNSSLIQVLTNFCFFWTVDSTLLFRGLIKRVVDKPQTQSEQSVIVLHIMIRRFVFKMRIVKYLEECI